VPDNLRYKAKSQQGATTGRAPCDDYGSRVTVTDALAPEEPVTVIR